MSNVAAALAFELGNHIDDLVSDGPTALEMPDGGAEVVGHLADTTILPEGQMTDTKFLVVLADGRKVLVECTEVND